MIQTTERLGLLKPDETEFFDVSHQNENMDRIDETAAKKSIYGDDSLNRGRMEGSKVGEGSFAFGDDVIASGRNSHAEGGCGVQATGDYSHAEGEENAVASGRASHAEGAYSFAKGGCSHAEGSSGVTAEGDSSHAEGMSSRAKGCCSHAEGFGTTASNFASHACGKNNKDMAAGGGIDMQVGDAFAVGNGTEMNRSNALRITYLGDVLGTKAFQSSGADYAEYVKPWADGNIYNEDRVGYFVTVKNGLLEKACEGDYIVGVISGNPSVVGNADEDYYWRYERDKFNRIVMEDAPEMRIKTEVIKELVPKYETKIIGYIQPDDEDWEPEYDENGNAVPNAEYGEVEVYGEDGKPIMEEIEQIVPVRDKETGEYIMEETGKIIKNARMKLAEGYDPSLQNTYTERKDRKEWDYVGMVGVLPVRDDGTCIPDGFCRCGAGGIATLAEERGIDTYRVIERVSENIVSVLLK